MTPFKFRHLSDTEFNEVETQAKLSGIKLKTCPTCFSCAYPEHDRIPGEYLYKGQKFPCDCQSQIALRKAYLLAHIPDQYMRLHIDDFRGDQEVIKVIKDYIDNWNNFRIHGLGLEIWSSMLGTGKTFLATHVGKELVKKGEKVLFLPFGQMLTAMRYNEEDIIEKMYEVGVLILDEIIAPPHDSLGPIFAERFEDLIRTRTNYNGVNICTTNLNSDEIRKHYHRTYSLLEAKQIRIEITNNGDARQGFIAERNLEMALNGEIQPLR